MTQKDRRRKLSAMLHEVLGSNNVYFNPPESKKLDYPAIVYNLVNIDTEDADDTKYIIHSRYTVTYIRKEADSEIVDHLEALPYFDHDRQFQTDDLYHDVFTAFI